MFAMLVIYLDWISWIWGCRNEFCWISKGGQSIDRGGMVLLNFQNKFWKQYCVVAGRDDFVTRALIQESIE